MATYIFGPVICICVSIVKGLEQFKQFGEKFKQFGYFILYTVFNQVNVTKMRQERYPLFHVACEIRPHPLQYKLD